MKLYSFILLIILSGISSGAFSFSAIPQEKKKKKEAAVKPVSLTKAESEKLEQLFLEAEKAKMVEDWETAIEKYRTVLTVLPDNANVHFQLAQIYFATNKYSEAEKAALEAVKADGNNKWYLELLASLYMNTGKAKEASETFKLLLQKFPNNPEYYLNQGYLYARAGQFENAIKVYNQFEKNFGIDESVIVEKKNMYLRLNKFNEAVAEVHKLVEAFPGEVSYLLMEAELYQANRMKDKAAVVYQKILEIEPDNAQALLALADLGFKSGNEEQSIENIKKIFQNPQGDIDLKVKILYPYLQYWEAQKDKKQTAFELAELLTTAHPDEAKAFAIKADLYYLDGQDARALESYLRALELNKDIFQVWQQVMVIYSNQRDWTNLQKIANESAELFPNQAMVYLFKGTAEQQNKEYEKALKSFSKGEKMSVDNDKLRAQFLANQGDVFHSLNRHTESDSAYERSLKLHPENSYVLNNYSYYLSLRKTNLERAKQMSAYSNQLEPGNNSFLDTYAWILFQLKDYAGAKEWQEKALKAGGDQSGTILEHYGDILFHLGQKEEAINYWKKAKELGTDSSTIDRKISEQRYIEE